MSDAEVLLARLADAGIAVASRDGMVVLSPRSAVTPELADAVRAAKPELIRLLMWDDDHAEHAIAETLTRIADRPRRGDQREVDLEECVNVAALRRDRAAFDVAIAKFEQHVLAAYGARAEATA